MKDSRYENRRIETPINSCILAIEKMRGWLSGKAYVGQEVLLKKQLSELAADKQISPREKSE